MIKSLYSPFFKWTEKGTLWVYSDPHFSDPDMVELRKNYIGDDEQIARINSKVGKNDTIIFLGDIGNEEMIRKIRGYKVLIMGNHDKGASKYKRQIVETKFDKSLFSKERVYEIANRRHPGWKITIKEGFEVTHAPFEFWWMEADNGLFDEVYEGPLFIAEKLILSHEPIDLPYAFNIHGHDHSNWHTGDRHLNICAEHIDYYPVNINRLLKNGLTSKVDSIHRMTIDRAVMKKNRPVKPTVAYICDQSQCEDCSADNGFCYHTTDIRHAENFEEVEPGKFMEKEHPHKELSETRDLLNRAYKVIGHLIDKPNQFEE